MKKNNIFNFLLHLGTVRYRIIPTRPKIILGIHTDKIGLLNVFASAKALESMKAITNKNAIKTQEEFSKEGIEVIRVPEVTGDEKTQIKKFQDLLKKTDLKDTQFRDLTLDPGETFQYNNKTYKAGDIIIIKETVNVQSAG